MIFNEFSFFLFLTVFIGLDLVGKVVKKENPIFHKLVLLLMSYFFYCYWDWRFGILLLWSTLIDFYTGHQIGLTDHNRNKKIFLWISLVNNLGVLAFFKYFNFFIDSAKSLLEGVGFNVNELTLNIILPVGISFYTFQTMSYTIDIYRGQIKPTKSILDFSIFVAFFPQLVAGPIERASNLLPKVKKYNGIKWSNWKEGVDLMFIGLVKKVLIADNIGSAVDKSFTSDDLTSPNAWAGIILFSFQILFDFSGYSDIARGLGKLLGLELMKNFNQPYFSKSLSEFWRRWHISLSTWLRDYLYIPLGGNRRSVGRTYFNLMLTMILGGLWHGASWNFVIWGSLHGLYLVVFRLLVTRSNSEVKRKWFVNFVRGVLVYLLVLITWIPFRASNIDQTISFFFEMISFTGAFDLSFIGPLLLVLISLLLIELPAYLKGRHTFLLELPNYLRAGIYFVGLIAIIVNMVSHMDMEKPFIYFQF